jgi:hypothetical protein
MYICTKHCIYVHVCIFVYIRTYIHSVPRSDKKIHTMDSMDKTNY